MADTNSVIMLGRLVKGAESVVLNQGKGTVVKFTIAVNDDVKEGSEWKQRANFFDVNFYGNYAKAIAESLTKGREVLIEGKLHQDRWETDGKTSSRILIRASNVKVLREPGKGTSSKAAEPSVNESYSESESDPEEIPF